MNKYLKNIFFFLLFPTIAYSQQVVRKVGIEELFHLAALNSKELDISRQHIGINSTKTKQIKTERLPKFSAGISAGYIGNATILEPNFNFSEKVDVPHFTNSYEIEGSLVLYQGNRIKNRIAQSMLGEELAVLEYDQDEERIKLLLLGRYMELYSLYSSQKVYAKNMELAKVRLKNIEGLNRQGMVTKNDIIRSQLQITDLEVQADQVDNDIAIINKELVIVLGLPEHTIIEIDEEMNTENLNVLSYDEYLKNAFNNSPAIKANVVRKSVADYAIKISKAERLPTLDLYAGSGLNRPFMNSLPPKNIYLNLYQVGIRLRYDVSSLYQTKEKIKMAEQQRDQQRTVAEHIEEQVEIAVNSAYVKFNESRKERDRREMASLLADDNYRIIEKKYLNQLALITDILDASTAKISADLNLAIADAKIVYQWYLLQKVSGKL